MLFYIIAINVNGTVYMSITLDDRHVVQVVIQCQNTNEQ